jgi:protein phosphatase methylesterase 1
VRELSRLDSLRHWHSTTIDMSDIAKSFARAKLGSLPPEAPLREDTEDEPYNSASSVSSTGTIRPTVRNKKKFVPLSSAAELHGNTSSHWTEFFEQELYLDHVTDAHTAQYHVYVVEPARAAADAPVKEPIFVLHHGAGSSAMTFALFVKDLRKLLPKAGIVAVDARGHGDSVVRNTATGEVDGDLSVETLTKDLVTMVCLTAAKLKWTEDTASDLPSMLLVGHSLGAAVVTHAASSAVFGHGAESGQFSKKSLIGFCAIDAVEGYAVEALKHMRAYLAAKPTSFDSVDEAVEWHVKSRTIRNIDSARLSVPSLLVLDPSGSGQWLWRTDLSVTEDFWTNWFTGMSKKFLSGAGAKLLILAGTDRLDKELMIGQMQGKLHAETELSLHCYRQIPVTSHSRSWTLCARGLSQKNS